MELFTTFLTSAVLYQICLWFVGFWVIIELIFWYILDFILLPNLQKLKKPVPIEPDPVGFIKKILDLLDSLESYDIKKYLEGFFHWVKLDEIYSENLTSFLSWAMFAKSSHQLTENEISHLDEITKHLNERYQELRDLKKGKNLAVSHCDFSLQPISYIHRPLALYIAAGLSEVVFNVFCFRLAGYQSFEMNGLNYWIKQGGINSTISSLPPVLIFHGISPGWSLYGLLIKYLEPNRTVILVDFESIKIKSMRFHCPSIPQFVSTITAILDRHHIHNKVSIVGHSFGTIIAGWLVHSIPSRISHLTLLDPVSLLLAFPDVAYSFLYKKPKTLWEWVIYLGASKEITVAHALYRHFCWHKNILWLEDVDPSIGVVVGIGSLDEISDMKAVGEYVKKCSEKRKKQRRDDSGLTIAEITCVEWKDYHHGQILVSRQPLQQFISVIKSSEKQTSSH
jgi:hypothetical protein